MSGAHGDAGGDAAYGAQQQRILTLAQAAGIQIQWVDAFGQPQTVAGAALSRILDVMELPHDTQQAYDNSLRRLGHHSAVPSLPPLITAEVDRPVALPAL